MALVINSNVASLTAQRNLSSTQQTLATSLQRLSSGLRINSAKDDAAGMFTVERMTADIRGLNQAVRNAADGISLAQTAEGALSQVSANLQRIREIAVQSANGTVEDRTGLQAEVNQLTQEISRIITTTQFNGTNLLSGSSSLIFQVGADGVSNAQIAVTTTDLTATTGYTAGESTAANTIVQATSVPASDADAATYNAAVEFVNLATTAGVSGVTTGSGPGDPINGYTSGTDDELDAAYSVMQALAAYWTSNGSSTASTSQAGAIAAAQAAADVYNNSSAILNSYNSNLSAGGTIDVSSQNAAATAIANLDADVNKISTTRATFGAVQNRFEAVIVNLQNYSENLSAARGRIQDADFAMETAQLTRAQILQQAGTSMLAQANTLPQAALALLRA